MVDKKANGTNNSSYSGKLNPNVAVVNEKGKSTLEKPLTFTTETFISSEGTYFKYDSSTN